jgi:hypothetical protein
MQKSLPWLHGK